ncbi:MAG: LPXTG cell wall anchor domain-containing protein [Caldilineaceae bacterium]
MIGRAPAKFSLENGAIAVGDALTSASLPGAAMKATQAGPHRRLWLQSLDEAVDGKLLVWLQPGTYLPPAQLDALNQLAAAQTAAQTPATANAQTAQSGLPLMGGMLMAGAAALLMLRKRRA